jgi:hypothetical protein
MLGAMTRRRGTILALALATAVAGTGCVRTGEDAARHQARRTALQDAAALAAKVGRLQFPQGGDPGTDEYEPPWTNAAMVRRIAEELDGTGAGHSAEVLEWRSSPATPGSASSAPWRPPCRSTSLTSRSQ